MTLALPNFSPPQWHFLAVLEALETPVPIEIVGMLVPLTPVPLFDLIRRATELHILHQTDGSLFSLTSNLPPNVAARLKEINSADRISEVLDQLAEFRLMDRIDAAILVKLLLAAHREEEAARIQLTSAQKALSIRDFDQAITFLDYINEKRLQIPKNAELNTRFISMALHLSDLCFANGKGFQRVLPILQEASAITDTIGDKRSKALVDMHMGRVFYLLGKCTDGHKLLSAGKQVVEALGDEDILNQSVRFLGLYFFAQGEYKQALAYFETAVEQIRQAEDHVIDPFAPMFFALSALGFYQLDRAFTMLDVFHRKAEKNNQLNAAAILRTVLGYILLRHQKLKEGFAHLSIAQNMAFEQGNLLALYLAKLFLTYYQFLAGDLLEARNSLLKALNEGARAGLAPLHAHFPWIADMLLEFERHGIKKVPDCSLDSVAECIMNGPTVPARGWLLRLLAKRVALQNGPVEQIHQHLENAILYYQHSEFKAELSKTQLELARLELSKGNRDKAQAHAREAWRNLPAYAEHIFPDDLQYLIENVSKAPFLKSFTSPEVILNRCTEIMDGIIPASDVKVLFTRLVTAANWFFSAERSGLFVFEDAKKWWEPQLIGAVNLTEIETVSENFTPRLKAIIETVREARPVIQKILIEKDQPSSAKAIRFLCFPLKLEEGRQCALYHESAALSDCFDYLDDHTLKLLRDYFEGLSRRIWEYCKTAQRKACSFPEETPDQVNATRDTIIGQSPAFLGVSKKAKRIADADYAVLIQGETGAGKEVMARWIHQNSPRRHAPYVIIDSTTIAENLMESELFGHEKGAFTGADRLKPGRVELANKGTLFLDEVGELPLSIQAKLLRVLEEKTLTRVGGSRVHHCDFRLIAATNRDLAKEVKAGRFREDLFYRLNVLPLQIPPLRDRKEDIPLLARHFLEIACRRLKRKPPPITPLNVSALLSYSWPGNIRELKNIIERAALLSGNDHLELQLSVSAPPSSGPSHSFEELLTIAELQRRYITHVIKTTGGRISGPKGAAEILGLNRGTLYSRMKKLGVTPDIIND